MDINSSKCRFLKEYASFLRSYIRHKADIGVMSQDDLKNDLKRIDMIVKCHDLGYVSLFEVMSELSDIGEIASTLVF